MTRLERARIQRHRLRLRQAQREPLPDWPDRTIMLAQLQNKANAEATMKAHDRKRQRRRTIEQAICIPAIADEAFHNKRKISGFDEAERYFRDWLNSLNGRLATR